MQWVFYQPNSHTQIDMAGRISSSYEVIVGNCVFDTGFGI